YALPSATQRKRDGHDCPPRLNLSIARRSTNRRDLRLGYNPDIPVLQRISVPLELNRSGRAFWLVAMPARRPGDLYVVVNHHTIVFDRYPRILHLVAVFIAYGVGELHVVSLPGQRRSAHVHLRIGLGINAATLVIEAL